MAHELFLEFVGSEVRGKTFGIKSVMSKAKYLETTPKSTSCNQHHASIIQLFGCFRFNRVTPKSSIFNRVFHYFHHPFWGVSPLFLETPISWICWIHKILRDSTTISEPHSPTNPLTKAGYFLGRVHISELMAKMEHLQNALGVCPLFFRGNKQKTLKTTI